MSSSSTPTDDDDLDDTERAELHDSIRESFEDAKADRTVDAAEFATKLRDRTRTAPRRTPNH